MRCRIPFISYSIQKKGSEGEALKIYREYQQQFDPNEELFGGIAF
jgi:hypothetical protein